jgi:glycosyltransferase involved in cell wall biosynthesis
MKPAGVVLMGGSAWCRGGVEEFIVRLQRWWSPASLPIVRIIPTDTAISKHSRGTLFGALAWLRSLAAQLAALLKFPRRSRPLLWLHYGNAVDLVSLFFIACVYGRSRIFVTMHCARPWSHLRSPRGRWLAGRVLRMAALVSVVSRDQQDLLREIGVTRVTRIPTLLGPAAADAGESRAPLSARVPRSMLFAGRVSPEKGIREAIDLVRELSVREGQGWTLDVFGAVDAGVETMIAPAVEAARAAGATLRFHGWISAERLHTEIASRRYFVYLSVMDAYPLAVLESLAAGTLPLVYDIPGTDEIVQSWGGVKVAPGRSLELVPLLLQLERQAAMHAGSLADPLTDRAGFARHFGQANIQQSIDHLLQLVERP